MDVIFWTLLRACWDFKIDAYLSKNEYFIKLIYSQSIKPDLSVKTKSGKKWFVFQNICLF